MYDPKSYYKPILIKVSSGVYILKQNIRVICLIDKIKSMYCFSLFILIFIILSLSVNIFLYHFFIATVGICAPVLPGIINYGCHLFNHRYCLHQAVSLS